MRPPLDPSGDHSDATSAGRSHGTSPRAAPVAAAHPHKRCGARGGSHAHGSAPTPASRSTTTTATLSPAPIERELNNPRAGPGARVCLPGCLTETCCARVLLYTYVRASRPVPVPVETWRLRTRTWSKVRQSDSLDGVWGGACGVRAGCTLGGIRYSCTAGRCSGLTPPGGRAADASMQADTSGRAACGKARGRGTMSSARSGAEGGARVWGVVPHHFPQNRRSAHVHGVAQLACCCA